MAKSSAPRRHLPGSPFKAPVTPPLKTFALGDRVTHDEHGLGRVVSVDGDISVVVDFGPFQKRITTPFPKMTLL